MSEIDEPVRLLDDPSTSGALRSLLAAARSDALDRSAVARVQTRVHERIATPANARWWWGGGVGTAAIIGWLALRPSDPAASPELAATANLHAPVSAPSVGRTDERGESKAIASTLVPGSARAIPSVTRDPALATPIRERRRSDRTAAAREEPSASEEARLLLAARRSLARDPAAALARTQEHERRFSTGALTEERELVAVRALVALDRGAEAEARGERFVARFPDSVHRAALERALATEP